MKSLLFGTSADTKGFNFGALALRLIFGLSMAFGHGLSKLPPSEKFISGVEEMGFPLPVVFAWSAGLAEFLGGLLIAAGLLTRPSAAFLAFTMFIAAFVRHAEDPFNKKELALLYFAASFAIVLFGSGRYALDTKFRAGGAKPKKK